MADEFPITLELGKTIRTFFHSQFFRTPPYPTHSFAGQTIIVTGSNTGLGLEAAKHFYRLNASRVILAVRTIKKGESAKEDIVRSVTHRTDPSSIEVWALDLSNTESTLAFAEKAKGLERLDVLLENAGVNNRTWEMSEGVEQTIQVNVLNTFLLALSLLPKLRETKIKFADSTPHLTIVSSEVHHFTKFKEIEAKNIYERLNEKKGYNGQER
jgi:retinol dehydrogenase-12